MLTSNYIKQKAKEFGADLCGIGDVKYFEGCDPHRDPRLVCPNAKCIIGFGFRVNRSLYRGMARGNQFYPYTMMGVKTIDEEISEVFLLKMAGIIEDEGYDACVHRNVSNLRIKGDKSTNPEVIYTYELQYAEPVEPGLPEPDIIYDFAECARICGMGSISCKGNVLTPEYGPFVRFVFLTTDAPLETDAPFEGNLCDNCGECAAACPGHAIGPDGLDSWQCAVYYRGAHKSNPFMPENFLEGWPDREEIRNGDKRFDSESAKKIFPELDFLPHRPHLYSPCLCGKACDIACYNHLKGRKEI